MTKPCVVCGKHFRSRQPNQICCSPTCREERRKAMAHAYDAAKRNPVIRNCLRCGTALEARTRKAGNRLYCSESCKIPALDPVAGGGVPCQHCGRPFAPTNRRQKFCAQSCRVADFKAKHVEDEGEEIPVVDIDEAPRRLAVAKLFDRFEGGGAFDHFTPPQWINPADRRASR